MNKTMTALACGLMVLGAGCSAQKGDVENAVNSAIGEKSVETKAVDTKAGATEFGSRPNVIVILADDLGYSDIGAFGGEIATPNIDSLIASGLQMTNFYAAGTCSPTRSMLMSGVDHHLAGVGAMGEHLADNQRGQRGYEGYLNHDVVSLATRMQAADYHTVMAGKWHLGRTEELSPFMRGFDESFGLLVGGASHLDERGLLAFADPADYRENGTLLNAPDDYTYSTDFYTEKMIGFIEDNKDSGKPFFGYLAYTAPHWPLQARPEDIAKYKGRYDAGWLTIQKERFERMKTMGLVSSDAKLPPIYTDWPAWDALSDDERAYEVKRMEIYAAMIDRLDQKIGDLVSYLKDSGQYENTVIMFMSDNGSEGAAMQDMEMFKSYMAEFDNSYESIGTANSYVFLEERWAQVSGTPLHFWKGLTSDGGMKVPAFVTHGGFANQGARYDGVVSILDVMPTLLDLAGANAQTGVPEGADIHAPQGKSMLPLLTGKSDEVRSETDGLGWELFTRLAYRQGPWKATKLTQAEAGKTEWALYNVSNDPGEIDDISAQHPDVMAQMIAGWQEYAATNNVIIGSGPPDR